MKSAYKEDIFSKGGKKANDNDRTFLEMVLRNAAHLRMQEEPEAKTVYPLVLRPDVNRDATTKPDPYDATLKRLLEGINLD